MSLSRTMSPDTQRILRAVVASGSAGLLTMDIVPLLPHLGRRAVYARLLWLINAGFVDAESERSGTEGTARRKRYVATGKAEQQQILRTADRLLEDGPYLLARERALDMGSTWEAPYLRPLPGRPDAHEFRQWPSRRGSQLVYCYAQR